MPLDVSTAASASTMVAEEVEKLSLGVLPSYSFGGGKVYGLLNYPNRLTKVFSNPWLADGSRDPNWTPGLLQKEVLAARRSLADRRHYGPFVLYVSSDFDEVLDDDYNIGTAGVSSSITLRERLAKVTVYFILRAKSQTKPFSPQVIHLWDSTTKNTKFHEKLKQIDL
jgi:hypothetical protein